MRTGGGAAQPARRTMAMRGANFFMSFSGIGEVETLARSANPQSE
jgi:hypothetical protein